MCNYNDDCSPYETSLPLGDVTKVTTLNLIQTNGTYFLVKWEINMLSKLEIKLFQTA